MSLNLIVGGGKKRNTLEILFKCIETQSNIKSCFLLLCKSDNTHTCTHMQIWRGVFMLQVTDSAINTDETFLSCFRH